MKIEANGVEINYELSGPESAPVVMLSHSLLANLSMWDPQMEALAGYRVLRYDTRGHGGSEAPPGEYTFELLAEDARALLGALGIETTHFVGLSMGGMIGMVLGIDYPEVLDSLVLCDTRGHSPEAREEQRAERMAAVKEHGIEPLVEGALSGWFSDGFRESHPEVMDAVRAMIRTASPTGLIGCSHAINVQNSTPRLSEITAPTLIVVGEEDIGTPVSESKAMQERIAGAKLVILPEARHLSNMERPAEFNEALAGFLGALR